MPTVLGVDSSTQSTKVEWRDADSGRLLGSGRAPHPVPTPPRSEQDPHVWWSAFHEALAAAGDPPFDAVAVSAQQHGMVVLDAGGEVVRPAKLWNDTESAADAEWLLGRLPDGAAGWAAACGSVPVASFTITKLSWLHRTEPDAFARLARVLLPHDWLTRQLTGESLTDRGDASGTGYWSPAQGEYRHDLLAIVDDGTDWPSALPSVLDPLTAVPHRDGRTVVAPGTGDNMATALGVGLEPGDVVLSLGTSGTVFAAAEQPTADATGAVAGFADATGRFLPLVCTLNATRVTDALARLLGVDREGFESLALAGPAGADGLVLVPYFDGERTPNRPEATGILGGLRSDVARESVARAAVEGVVCGLLEGLDALSAAGPPVGGGRLVLVGGGARSPSYQRVVADLSGMVVTVPHTPELAAAGACVQAAGVLHQRPFGEVAEAWGLIGGTEVEPDEGVDRVAIRAAYAAARG